MILIYFDQDMRSDAMHGLCMLHGRLCDVGNEKPESFEELSTLATFPRSLPPCKQVSVLKVMVQDYPHG